MTEPLDRDEVMALASQATLDGGDWAEFGVGEGKSSRRMLRHLGIDRTLWLFDSFEGLPEDWDRGEGWVEGRRTRRMRPAGSYGRGGVCPPELESDPRTKVRKGLFRETVRDWEVDFLSLIHIDCDIYSSTVDALEGCWRWLFPGAVVLFDEYQGYPNSAQHEERAWLEYCEKYGVEWKELFRTKMQMCVRVN